MKRSVIETVLGAVVLVLAGFFLVFSYRTANISKVSGYDITASFSGIGGLAVGDDVRIGGVRIGSVNNVALDDKTYLAVVTMSINPSVKLPDDTAAIISSDSLLGGRYLEIQPGASDEMLKPGQQIKYTQAPQNLEQLLGKFIFNMQPKKEDKTTADSGNEADKPAVPVITPEATLPKPDNTVHSPSEESKTQETEPSASKSAPSVDTVPPAGSGSDKQDGQSSSSASENTTPSPAPSESDPSATHNAAPVGEAHP